MNAAKWSWLAVVCISIVAAGLLAASGYAGYAITLGAVGGAAAINLL